MCSLCITLNIYVEKGKIFIGTCEEKRRKLKKKSGRRPPLVYGLGERVSRPQAFDVPDARKATYPLLWPVWRSGTCLIRRSSRVGSAPAPAGRMWRLG